MLRAASVVVAVLLGVGCVRDPRSVRWKLVELETPAGPESSAPGLVAGADGSIRLSWLEPLAAGGHALRTCALEEDGWGDVHEVARGDDWFVNWADVPALAALSDGTLLATWLQRLGEGTYAYGVRHALSRDGGESWSAPAWLHDDRAPVEHGFVSLVAEEDSFRALWLDGRAYAESDEGEGAMQLRTRTIAADGTLGPDTLLDERVCDCCPTTMVRRRDGHAAGFDLVTYAAFRDRSEGEVRDVAFARLSEEHGHHADVPHEDGWQIDGCPVNGPVLTLGRHPKGLDLMGQVWFTAEDERPRIRAESMWYSPVDGWWRCEPVELPALQPFGSVGAAYDSQGKLWVTWLESSEDGLEGVWRMAALFDDGGDARTSFPIELATADPGRGAGVGRLVREGDGLVFAWIGGGEGGGVRSARIEFIP